MKKLERSHLYLSGTLLVGLLLLTVNVLTAASGAQSPEMSFEKLELRTSFGGAQEGQKGRLLVSANRIQFTAKDGKTAYFSIPSHAVTDLFYSRVSGRRIKTAVFVSPLLLFSKGKKHYMTISFDNGDNLVGAVEFRLDKSNYRGILHAVESVSGVTLEFDQEGIKDEKETVATADSGERRTQADLARLHIDSEPSGAEIEIEGAFAGTTPRNKSLKAGKYKIKLKKKGYKDWEREIEVTAGEDIPVQVQLEKD
jgi:hypothetical protein